MQRNRIVFLLIFCVLVASGLIVRLFSISILQHKQYVALASEQQVVTRELLPHRGTIYAQDAASGTAQIVAESVERFAVSTTPRNVVHKKEYAHLLATATGTDEAALLDTLEQDGLYMNPLKHGLTKDEVQQLAKQINALEKQFDPSHKEVVVNFDDAQGNTIYFIGGVFFTREFQRVYPEGPLLSQVVGFVNNHGQGQYGFEGQYDKELKGYAGTITLEQDSIGNLLQEKQAVEGKDGTSYELSIDRTVQYVVEKDLAAEVKDSEAQGGSVIVMDPKTGEIIAMASTPSYDPNFFGDITNKEIGLFDNPAISNSWEPGSIFKTVVMAAAIDSGVVTPDTENDFPESVTVDGYKIETALRKPYGRETMTKVIVNSDNVAMVWVADKLGNQKMYDYIRKFGFGDYSGVDLKNEIAGNVIPESKWRPVNRATISFGQGIAVTPLQIAAAYATIANNGKAVKPHIVHAIIHADGTREVVKPEEGDQVISTDTVQKMKQILTATVVDSHNRAGTEGYKVGGKTGTAQIPDPEHGGYLPDAYNHSFAGMAPVDDPRYVMLVKIDHPNLKKVGLFAESTAVPLFGQISTFLLHYYQIPPTNVR